MVVVFLPPILDQFRKRFPGINVDVITDTSDNVIQQVQAGVLDLGIVFSPASLPKGNRLAECELLYKEEIVVVVGRGHPLAKRKTLTLDEVEEYPVIMHSKTTHFRRAVDYFLEKAGVTPKVVMEVENDEALERMIEINKVAAFLTRRRAITDKVHYLKISDKPMYLDVRLVLPPPDHISAAAKEFAQICREARVLRGWESA